jgi:hypothetical protein
LKQALFMPIVYGLVQSEPAAKIIAELTLAHRAIGRYSGLVLDVFSDLLGADFRKYMHAGGSKIRLFTDLSTAITSGDSLDVTAAAIPAGLGDDDQLALNLSSSRGRPSPLSGHLLYVPKHDL